MSETVEEEKKKSPSIDSSLSIMSSEGNERLSNLPSKNRNMFMEQLLLLMWKRKLELTATKTEILKTFLPPLLFFLLMVLFKEALNLEKIEEYLVPISFWVLIQKNVVAITYEKSARLQEAMSMMVSIINHNKVHLCHFKKSFVVVL